MSTPTTTKQGNLMFLRTAITLQTVAVFVQAITAGLLLSSPSGGALHSAGAYTVFVVTLLHLIVAILVWRPGGGSPRPILYAAGFFGITSAQVALGLAHVTALHVPLGVLMFGMSVLQLVWIWTGRRARLGARGMTVGASPHIPGGCVVGLLKHHPPCREAQRPRAGARITVGNPRRNA